MKGKLIGKILVSLGMISIPFVYKYALIFGINTLLALMLPMVPIGGGLFLIYVLNEISTIFSDSHGIVIIGNKNRNGK